MPLWTGLLARICSETSFHLVTQNNNQWTGKRLWKKNTHSAVLLCCIQLLWFFTSPFFVRFQKCLGKKKHGPHQTKNYSPPASGSARKIATIMDFSVKAPSKVDCKVWIIVIFCNAKEPRLNSVLQGRACLWWCVAKGEVKKYLWNTCNWRRLEKIFHVMVSQYQSKVHYGEQK